MRGVLILCKPLLLALAILFAGLWHGEARGDMLVIVNEDNPLDSLTLKEVKQLFLGRMRRFPSVNNDVDVLDREETSLTHRLFYQHVVQMDSNRLKRYRARYLFSGQGRLPEVVTGQDNVIAKVQKDISAVGYVDLSGEGDLPKGVKVVYRQHLPVKVIAESSVGRSDHKGGSSEGADLTEKEDEVAPE